MLTAAFYGHGSSVVIKFLPVPALLVSVALLAAPARAQMQLPGATAPTQEGTVSKPAAPAKAHPAGPPPPPKVPSDDGLLGRTLVHDGRAGAIQFSRNGKDLQLAKVTLAGEKISKASEACTVEQSGMPVTPSLAGRPNGVTHYTVALAACPFEFDVLDGAILVSPIAKACEIAASDCRIDPVGLWGQPASEIGAARTKEIEHARAPAEAAMRAQFRSWIESAGRDRDLVRKISHDQAGFSSRRADLCAHYARESEHGYCSLVLTEARTAALAARVKLPDDPEGDAEQKPGRRKR